jgi:hypothetical protein
MSDQSHQSVPGPKLTPEANVLSESTSNPSVVQPVNQSEQLTNAGGNVVPNQSSTSMSPAPLHNGGNCMLKIGGKSKKHHKGKSHKKHRK